MPSVDLPAELLCWEALTAQALRGRLSIGPYPRILDTGFDYAAVGSVAV